MRIGSKPFILLCFINLVRGQTETSDGESEALGDSEWWSKRITRINRKQSIGLGSGDSGRRGRGWTEEETRKSERPFRPLTSDLRAAEIRDGFESQRERFRNGKDVGAIGERFDGKGPVPPSPILLPPYGFASPLVVHRDKAFDENDVRPPWKNESTAAGNSGGSSAVGQIRIYEITKFNSSIDDKVESKQSYDDVSSSSLGANNENRLVDVAGETSVDMTKMRREQYAREEERERSRSFRINEARETEMIRKNSTTVFNRKNYSPNLSRGTKKYQHDFESEKIFARKQTLPSADNYDWQRRYSAQRSNHFKFNSESNLKVGAVPGVPGRDYPVHQEHTHHHLHNVAERFSCPRTPKTLIYLADRASRCQIFYVCYGSKTGVPMVCPNGTLFSEPLQVCDWWFNVSC